MTAGDSPSPTEEELEALGRQIRAYCPWSDARHVFDAMRNALRSARESARVAARERDELVTERESWGDYSKHLETQLTDRDRMIAGLRDAINYACKDAKRINFAEETISRDAMERLEVALSTSHPIAAAFEARVARERMQEIAARIDDAGRHLEASIYEREDVQTFLGYLRDATKART